jgi:hypothetical protein
MFYCNISPEIDFFYEIKYYAQETGKSKNITKKQSYNSNCSVFKWIYISQNCYKSD